MKKTRFFFTTIVSSLVLFNIGLFISDNLILKYSSFGLAVILILFSIYQFSNLIKLSIKSLNEVKENLKAKEKLFEGNIYKNHEFLVGSIEYNKKLISKELEHMNNEIIIKLEKTETENSARMKNFREENFKILENLKGHLDYNISKIGVELLEKINNIEANTTDNIEKLRKEILELNTEIREQINTLEKEGSRRISVVEENITSNLNKGNELISEKLRILKENVENKINQLDLKSKDRNDNLNSGILQLSGRIVEENTKVVEEVNIVKTQNLNYMNTVNNKIEENIYNLKLDMKDNYNSLLNEANVLNIEIKEVSKETALVVDSIKKMEESVMINEKNKEDVFEGIMNEQEQELQMLSKKIEMLTKTIDEGLEKYKSEIELIIKKQIIPASIGKQEQIAETKNVGNSDIIENDQHKTIKKNGKIEYYLDKRKNQETQFIYDRGILVKSKMLDTITKSLINEFIYDENHSIIESIEYVNGKRSIKTIYKNNEITKKINLENGKEILY